MGNNYRTVFIRNVANLAQLCTHLDPDNWCKAKKLSIWLLIFCSLTQLGSQKLVQKEEKLILVRWAHLSDP